LAMGHPPSERRDAARFVRIGSIDEFATRRLILLDNGRAIFGHVDFLGIGATSLKEEVRGGEICTRFLLSAVANCVEELYRPNSNGYHKHTRTCRLSSFLTYGWTTRKRFRL